MDMAIHVNIYEDVHGEVENCNQLVVENGTVNRVLQPVKLSPRDFDCAIVMNFQHNEGMHCYKNMV